MDALREWLRRVWHLLNRRRFEEALRQEMESHRAMSGETGRFGNVLRLREEARDVWGWNWLDDAARDVRLAARALSHSPSFALASIVILSLGIGVNLALFQIVNATLLQPLRVKDPATLVQFHRHSPTFSSNGVPYPMADFVREHNTALSAVLTQRRDDVAWEEGDGPRVAAAYVSVNWFEELGATAVAGRLFHQALDDEPDDAVVVLSHDFWRGHLGGRTDIVGNTVRINDRPALVVGVVAADFPDVNLDGPKLWMLDRQIDYFNVGSQIRTDWNAHSAQLFGRLRAGVSLDAARSSLQTTVRSLSALRPDDVRADEQLMPYSAATRFLAPREVREVWTAIAAVSVLTILVLMIACLNMANLSLARAISRVREMTVRAALGASRGRVVRHLTVESALLACLGGIGGLLLGAGAARIVATAMSLPAYLDLSPDWRSTMAAFVAAALATLVTGLVPAWKIGRRDLAAATKDGGGRTSQSLHTSRLRSTFVTCQIAGSCVLLVLAGQVARGFQRLNTEDLGFDFENVAVLDPSLGRHGMGGLAADAYWRDVRPVVAAHPETERTVLVSSAPIGDGASTSLYNSAPGLVVTQLAVEPGFFSLMRIPVLMGRDFESDDDRQTAVIVSEKVARTMYGTTDVIGQGFPKGTSQPIIVGVVGDAPLMEVMASNGGEQYAPMRPASSDNAVLLARARTDPAQLLAPMRQAARAADARVLAQARLMRSDFEGKLHGPRLASVITGLVAFLALALACVGIFGVVSYGAGLRTKEVGICLALGARPRSIVRVLSSGAARSGCIGVAIGLAAAWLVSEVFAGRPLYGQPFDATVYALAAIVLIATGAVAAVLPTLRMLLTDPLQALRHE